MSGRTRLADDFSDIYDRVQRLRSGTSLVGVDIEYFVEKGLFWYHSLTERGESYLKVYAICVQTMPPGWFGSTTRLGLSSDLKTHELPGRPNGWWSHI